MILKRAWMTEDLPAPVLPTIAIFCPGLTLKEIFLRIKGRFYLYFAERFLI